MVGRFSRRCGSAMLLVAALAALAALAASSWQGPASAADEKLALGEVSVPTPLPGADRAALASAAEGEIHKVDASHVKRRVIVSVAIVETSDAPSVALAVDACLRDQKSGTMLAILKGRAALDSGPAPVSPSVRAAVLRAAVRSALQQIPTALAGS
jgi:hypothetical protein